MAGSEGSAPWTSDGADRLRDAAAQLAAAIVAHAEAVIAVTTDTQYAETLRATERLIPSLSAYADAKRAYTGNGFPFDALLDFYEDDEEGSALTSRAHAAGPVPGISVLQRRDYRLADESSVIDAGRAARPWQADKHGCMGQWTVRQRRRGGLRR
jgi:hypothetical protein